MTSKTAAWIAGGVAVLGLGYYLYLRKKESSEQADVPSGEIDVTPDVQPGNVVQFPAAY